MMAFLPGIYHPAAINARSLLAQYGIGDPYGYRSRDPAAGSSGPSTAAPATSAYGYPPATGPNSSPVRRIQRRTSSHTRP